MKGTILVTRRDFVNDQRHELRSRGFMREGAKGQVDPLESGQNIRLRDRATEARFPRILFSRRTPNTFESFNIDPPKYISFSVCALPLPRSAKGDVDGEERQTGWAPPRIIAEFTSRAYFCAKTSRNFSSCGSHSLIFFR